MFAIILERDPLRWQDLPGYIESWVQVAGGLAAVALGMWFILRLIMPAPPGQEPWPGWQVTLFRAAFAGAILSYGVYAVLQLPTWISADRLAAFGRPEWQRYALNVGGGLALFAVALPLLADLLTGRLSCRRIWALARLSFKEAIRRKVLWAFAFFLVVLLFATWFVPYKPESQVRNYVQVLFTVMSFLLLFVAGLLAAFSIPTDVRSLSIHTIVTKPVERFEIVLGRFIGYVMLMTIVLLVMTGLGLLYAFREIDPDAQKVSMRARVPLYGTLQYRGKDPRFRGESVGREWEYRRYIQGGPNTTQRAVWVFQDIPSDLASRGDATIPCEFTFDIFRTLKGEEGKGVLCSFVFLTRNWDQKLKSQFEQEGNQERSKPGADLDRINNSLAEKYGYFELSNKEVRDYHTETIAIPAGIFRNALQSQGQGAELQESDPGQLQVWVKCESGGQFLGMAKHDLYILSSEKSFAWNFVKGAAGMWARLCILMAMAVTFSTYLSGVISFIAACFIYGAGAFKEYVQSLALNTAPGGGPLESLIRLVKKEATASPLDPTAGVSAAQGLDEAYRWVLRRFLSFLPDVERLDWSHYVGEGFDVALVNLASLNYLMMIGYVLPWALISYYLIKTREIATW